MNYETLINVIKDGSISVNPDELRLALLQIATDNKPKYAIRFLDVVCSYLKSQGCGEFSSNCSVYLLDTLSREADEVYANYRGEGPKIQKFIRNSIKVRVAPLN